MGAGGQYSPEVVQTEYSRRRSERPAHYSLACEAWNARTNPSPVLPRDRSRAHRDGPAEHRTAERSRRRTANAGSWYQSRSRADRSECGDSENHAILRDAWTSRNLASRMEGGDASRVGH